MQLPLLFPLLATPTTASWWPWNAQPQQPHWPSHPQQQHCVTDAFANLTFTRVRSILALQPTDLGNGTETLTKILAENFESTSDSYSMMAGWLGDVGVVGTINKTAEVAEVAGATRSQGGIETLALGTLGCLGMVWLWNLTRIDGEGILYPIRGMHYLVLNEEWKITELHTEVNSLAYAADLGFKIEYPNGTILPSEKAGS